MKAGVGNLTLYDFGTTIVNNCTDEKKNATKNQSLECKIGSWFCCVSKFFIQFQAVDISIPFQNVAHLCRNANNISYSTSLNCCCCVKFFGFLSFAQFFTSFVSCVYQLLSHLYGMQSSVIMNISYCLIFCRV